MEGLGDSETTGACWGSVFEGICRVEGDDVLVAEEKLAFSSRLICKSLASKYGAVEAVDGDAPPPYAKLSSQGHLISNPGVWGGHSPLQKACHISGASCCR